MDADEFKAWNEDMVRRFPSEDYYERSNAVVRWIEARRLRFLEAEIRRARPRVLVEVGCGACHVLERLDAPVRIGVDLSDTMLSVSARRTAGTGIGLCQCRAEHLPFADRSVDALVCTEVLEHVPDPDAVAAEAARVLAGNGIAIFTVPHEETIDRVKRFLRWTGLGRLLFANVAEERAKGWHLQDFTRKDFVAMMSKHFEVEKVVSLPMRGFALRYAARCRPLGREGRRE